VSGTLEWRFAGPCSGRVDQRSPRLPSRADGIALAITDLTADDESVGFVVRVAVGLDGEFHCWFRHIEHAVVVTIEDPDTRRATCFRLIDPQFQYLEEPASNYRPRPGPRRPSPVFTTSFVNAPIQVRCRPKQRPWGGLWVQATLQTLRSARIHVHLRG
jgi:hypothetical protein